MILFQKILVWLLFIDSLCAIATMWFGEKWYVHHFRLVSRIFPPAKGWPLLYLILVLWIGFLLYR